MQAVKGGKSLLSSASPLLLQAEGKADSVKLQSPPENGKSAENKLQTSGQVASHSEKPTSIQGYSNITSVGEWVNDEAEKQRCPESSFKTPELELPWLSMSVIYSLPQLCLGLLPFIDVQIRKSNSFPFRFII